MKKKNKRKAENCKGFKWWAFNKLLTTLVNKKIKTSAHNVQDKMNTKYKSVLDIANGSPVVALLLNHSMVTCHDFIVQSFYSLVAFDVHVLLAVNVNDI